MDELWLNMPFWSALCGWMVAQITKMICFFAQTRRIKPSYLISTGGMPSAHSAMACALATSVGLEAGLRSPLFAVTLAFAIVVMFDAQS
ncbi:MAG: divergent PAP2 family protein, partial [Lentisphaerae bacterium]|nr:divergent PAP2 family protein [Lentisphaerota bacterium]